jgi:hypothetical protein
MKLPIHKIDSIRLTKRKLLRLLNALAEDLHRAEQRIDQLERHRGEEVGRLERIVLAMDEGKCVEAGLLPF